MKSIKIKLKNQNDAKMQKLLSIFDMLDEISASYLPTRLEELQTKEYTPFKEHYARYRKEYPSLNSGVLQNHLRNLDSTVKSYISWCKKKKKLVSYPENIKSFIHLRNDMFRFEYNKKAKTFDAWLKFLKTYFPLNLCDYHLKALADLESLCDSSIIRDRKGDLCLRLAFKTKKEERIGDAVLGVDIGMVKPIVCSNGKMFGSGKYIKHKKIEFGKKRARNQSRKQEISNKQSNWTDDLNHKLSRELVDYCISNDIDVLSLEKLSGSHLANKRFRKYNWAFQDLLTKITYKAQNAGLKVVSVNPAYTSQTCSCCGLKEKSNRQSQSLYTCGCGYRANADINAAKNIQRLSALNGPTVNKATDALNRKVNGL